MTDDPSRATPFAVAKRLGIDLYPWQEKAIADACLPGKTAICAANESGKTTRVLAITVLWFFLAYPRGKCVLTSGSWDQVKAQLFPAISRHRDFFKGWTFNTTDFTTRKGGYCIGISTREPGRFEGYHSNGPEEPLMIGMDECKTIPDEIGETARERCNPRYLICMSSSGLPKGFFYRAFTEDARNWRRHTIKASDCPHIPQSRIDALIAKYKIDNPLIRSMLFSEFVDEANGTQVMIPLSVYNSAIRSKPLRRYSNAVAFMDFAAGGDENVLFTRQGNFMKMQDAWRERNTSSAVGRFLVLLNRCKKEMHLQQGAVFGDGGGLGIPMTDSIGEAGWEVHRVNNGSPANDSEHFADRAAEMWFQTKGMLERGELIIEDDPELCTQLTSRHFALDLKGRIKLESKDNLRQSPDRADAFVGAATCNPIVPHSYIDDKPNDPFSQDEPELEEEESAIPGANAGW